MKGINQYKQAHPIGRAFHTGLWGFARVHDCLDLSQCIYRTRRAAEMARADAARLAAVEEP